MRKIAEEELVYDRLGTLFDKALSAYDTQRRVETLVDDFLGQEDLSDRLALDVGCGLGFFSRRLAERGAIVTACDLGASLVERTVRTVGCRGFQADCLELTRHFPENHFDLVVSSECIEHTPDPSEAVRQMVLVLKPGGLLALSTPNLLWLPVVKLATWLRLRPFDGLENFSTWRSLRATLRRQGVNIVREKGLHIIPFQLRLHQLSRWCDTHCQSLQGVMINLCILGRRRRTHGQATRE